MPHLFTVPAGNPIARIAATHLLQRHPPEILASTIVFVPTRRSCTTMRAAFAEALNGKAALLPRCIALADIGNELLSLLGPTKAIALIDRIPPAMPLAQQRYLLTQQVAIFERKHRVKVTLDYALTMADALMELQENAARAGVALTHEALKNLVPQNFTEHWRDALEFLDIIALTWPAIEQEMGMSTTTAREMQLLQALAAEWEANPPKTPVYAVGSTASQASTAHLLKTIADMPHGGVILAGLDPDMDQSEWLSIAAGHPLFHLKQLLDQWPLAPSGVVNLTPSARSVWLEALAPAVLVPQWRQRPPQPSQSYIRRVVCRHPEEEARVISALLREALEKPNQHVALVTPDESLMAQVASHMKRYHITVDRLSAGALASTATGSLWRSLITAIANPERQLSLRSLLHHPLLGIEAALLQGLEKGWHGISRRYAGQLPPHEKALATHPQYTPLAVLIKDIQQLSGQQHSASGWVEACRELIAPWIAQSAQGHEAVEKALEALPYADSFGVMPIEDFSALLLDALSAPWRDAGLNTHPRIHFLTPVEARLQQFDRVILASMTDDIWPGKTPANPWLNLAAQQSLGFPDAAEQVSLMAHDMLMLASGSEVFLTYAQRVGGSPAAPSRFVERFLTLLESHGVQPATIDASHYVAWANASHSTTEYTPEAPIRPAPSADKRPRKLPVTAIEKLFSDPFSIYARHVLNLRKLEDIDAAPEAKDLGSLIHHALEALGAHWNTHGQPPSETQIHHIATQALRHLSERPAIDRFWRTRLLNALHYVNRLEESRRSALGEVLYEKEIEEGLTLAQGEAITLHGRIDRLERGGQGAVVVDYKTGEPPSSQKILDGHAPQLLAYSLLLGEPIEAVEYWALPRIGTQGTIIRAEGEAIDFVQLEEKLKAALSQMLEESTPFLARPTGSSERFANDYDGISRYDEWAG